ncbi:hypothetical protein TRICI_006627 [Trichomonascus ciferrii]|uniref:WW domain-containing protein n=1 Tax=Trichomonascus ciferrii TaxID=44093 RepID=A0A642UHE2_9ASCO|nr:hypothetical protein TRICI_006627 [Trichomonascus ciferrii]
MGETEDDGWEAIYDANYGQYYFYNRFTEETTWKNPRVNEGGEDEEEKNEEIEKLKKDPDFQKLSTYEKYKRFKEIRERVNNEDTGDSAVVPTAEMQKRALKDMPTTGLDAFNPDFNDPSVLANLSHDGRSLRKERAEKRVSKKQVKKFKDKKKDRKERKRREWLKN